MPDPMSSAFAFSPEYAPAIIQVKRRPATANPPAIVITCHWSSPRQDLSQSIGQHIDHQIEQNPETNQKQNIPGHATSLFGNAKALVSVTSNVTLECQKFLAYALEVRIFGISHGDRMSSMHHETPKKTSNNRWGPPPLI